VIICATLFPELKVLSIRACPSVTPEGLLSVLALPFLQHFDYFTPSPVPNSFVWGIATQNPSLESISVHLTTGDSEKVGLPAWSTQEKKAFFKQHPRIKALVNLVSTCYCSNYLMLICHFSITLRSILKSTSSCLFDCRKHYNRNVSTRPMETSGRKNDAPFYTLFVTSVSVAITD